MFQKNLPLSHLKEPPLCHDFFLLGKERRFEKKIKRGIESHFDKWTKRVAFISGNLFHQALEEWTALSALPKVFAKTCTFFRLKRAPVVP